MLEETVGGRLKQPSPLSLCLTSATWRWHFPLGPLLQWVYTLEVNPKATIITSKKWNKKLNNWNKICGTLGKVEVCPHSLDLTNSFVRITLWLTGNALPQPLIYNTATTWEHFRSERNISLQITFPEAKVWTTKATGEASVVATATHLKYRTGLHPRTPG